MSDLHTEPFMYACLSRDIIETSVRSSGENTIALIEGLWTFCGSVPRSTFLKLLIFSIILEENAKVHIN